MNPGPLVERTKLAYQPALDGMRCLGLISVLCAHACVVQPTLLYPASYMFVDMFFVISGYLITTLLLREHASTGRVSLRAFYIRRFTRLYPVIVMILAIMIGSRLFWPDADATPSWLFVVGTALYFANFVAIIHHADALNAWVSLWSLSIEEQFYAVWPIVLLWTMGRARRLRRPLVLVTLLTLAMWVWRSRAMYQAFNVDVADPSDHFTTLTDAWHLFNFSTFYRPDGLLIGCALALVLARPNRRPSKVIVEGSHRLRFVVVVTILAIVGATNGASAWQVYWGLALFNICIALLIVELLHHPGSLISRVLSFRPFLWIGRRSYFIYATHLAVFTFTFEVLEFTSLPEIAVTVGAIFALAGISYRFYENPVRRWGQRVSARIVSDQSVPPAAPRVRP
jgi:peptidoglycan/LPS O-acetylase OafA/YrhL